MGLFNKKCKHLFGEVHEDGYQYCTHCGYARTPATEECKHKWKELNRHPLTDKGSTIGFIYLFICEKCGEIKKERIS